VAVLKTTKSNTELILQVKQDNEVAFYNIYERYCKRLYGFVLRYVKIDVDAEEIVQEVFVKIWESRRNIDEHSSFESYLFTVAYNSTISLLRKRSNEQKYISHLKSIQQIQKAPELIDEIYFNELNDKVKLLFNELTSRQKEIFRLSREGGLSHEEIAQKLNISVNTVKKHMANTLSYLKSHIDKSHIVSSLFVSLFL
jgi:RNA polymerase sigma-70 factor (ECF subfamily)